MNERGHKVQPRTTEAQKSGTNIMGADLEKHFGDHKTLTNLRFRV